MAEWLRARFPTTAIAAPVAAPAPVAPQAAPAPAAAAPTGADAEQPSLRALIEKPFGAAARISLDNKPDFTPEQRRWLDDFIQRYNARSGKSKAFSQANRKQMSDPRVVTGFNTLWKDLVYPIVVDRSKGARMWDLDGNEYIDLLSCFGANLLGYQPDDLLEAMVAQLHAGIEVGPQHPMAAEVAQLITEFTGMERIAFCNTGSEAVMGAMRIARTVTGRKTIAIFSNSYHGIFDEVIVRGTKQLRSLSAAPGILANTVENVLVLDWASEDSLRVLRDTMKETRDAGFANLQKAQEELGVKVRKMLEARGFSSVAAPGYQAPCVVVSYTKDPEIQNGKKFMELGLQTAAGVPLQVGERSDFRTFRIGLFGLEKLKHLDRTVKHLAGALEKMGEPALAK